MEYLTPEQLREAQEREQQLEAQRRSTVQRQAQRSQRATQQAATAARDTLTPEIAAQTAEVSQPDRDRGFITQVGEGLDYVLSGDATADATNALAAGVNRLIPDDSPLKGATQAVDDFILSSDEIQKSQEEQIQGYRDRGQNIRAGVASAMEGAAEGSQAGLLAPATIVGRTLNQDTPWSNRPEILKDSAVGEAVFNIAEVVVPSLITGGIVPGAVANAPAFLATEAAIETYISQETNDDLIMGRTIARGFGEIADAMGMDGGQLTKDLIEGKTNQSAAFTAVIGFLQNLGINIGMNQLMRFFAPSTSVTPDANRVARATGKKPEAVQESLDNIELPPYRATAEPTDVVGIDTTAPTAKPDGSLNQDLDDAIALGGDPETVIARDRQNTSAAWDEFKQDAQTKGIDREAAARASTEKAIAEREKELAELIAKGGEDAQVSILRRQIRLLREGKNPYGTGNAGKAGNEYINSDAMVAETLRANGLDEFGLSAANRKQFATLSRVQSEQGMESLLTEAMKAIKPLMKGSKDKAAAMFRATQWWENNKGLIDEGNFEALALDFAADGDMVRTLKGKEGIVNLTKPEIDTYLREFAEATPEGLLASALVGEEIGVKGIRLATIANNLDSLGIDFTHTVDEFAELVDIAETFRMPQLRGKREWYVKGELQQKANIRKARDADVVDPSKTEVNPDLEGPSEGFLRIRRNEDDPGATFHELWSSAQNGDYDALQTVKQYMRAVAASDPSTAMRDIHNLDKALRNQLMKGNTEATQQLFYANMIGRVSTQVASLASSVARFIAEPLGAIASPLIAGGKTSDAMYGIGQIYGSFGALRDGLRAGRKAFATEVPLNAGSKLDSEVRTAAQNAARMDGAIEAYRKQLNEADVPYFSVERLTAELQYNYQRWANNPVNRLGARLLTAQDEGFKVAFGSQVASGRAFQKAFDAGDIKNLDTYVKAEMNSIFAKGVESGKITDRQVLQAGRALTFQNNIPMNGNFVDDIFQGVSKLGESGFIGKMFFPFVRASYNMLEVSARYEPTGTLVRLVPRYQKILKGQMGEAARLQLQSQISFGRIWLASGAFAAWQGQVTGFNAPDGVPKTSILIPASNKQGYIAVDYSRFEPFGTILAATADMVNSMKSGAIAERDYQRIADELVFTIASASMDKTFMTGLNDLASLLDFKSGTYNFARSATKLSASGLATPFGTAGAITRMVTNWSNPYQTIAKDPNSPLNTYLQSLRQRLSGGIGLPRMHDPLSGEPLQTQPLPGENPYVASFGSALNEMLWPGRVKPTDNNPNYQMMATVGFDFQRGLDLREYQGIGLSPDQQSKFSRAIAIDGRLDARMTNYFGSRQFQRQREIMERAVRKQGTSSQGSAADAARERIHSDIRKIIRRARQDAAQSVLLNDPEYRKRLQLSRGTVQAQAQPDKNSMQGKVQGLLAWSNGQIGIAEM